MRLSDTVFKEAIANVGVSEDPPGSNWGKSVSEYLNFCGINYPAPWCMAFVIFRLYKAATELKLKPDWPKSASCSAVAAWAKSQGRLLTDAPSHDAPCIFLVRATDEHGSYIAGRYTHTGVWQVGGKTAEGNSNNNGSAEGVCVASNFRHAGPRYHWIKID